MNGSALLFYDHTEKKENVVILSRCFSFPSPFLKSVLFPLKTSLWSIDRKYCRAGKENCFHQIWKKGSHIFILLPSSSLHSTKNMHLVGAFVLNGSSFDGSYSNDCMLTMCMTLSHDRERTILFRELLLLVVATLSTEIKLWVWWWWPMTSNSISSTVPSSNRWWSQGVTCVPDGFYDGVFFYYFSSVFLFFLFLSKCLFRLEVYCFPWLHTPTFSFCTFWEGVCLIHTHKVVEWIFTWCCCSTWSYKPMK